MTDQPTAPNNEDPLDLNDTTPGIGHNAPPEPLPFDAEALDKLKVTASSFIEVSDQWLKVDVNSDTLAGQINDQITGLRKLFKRIEDARKAAKKPHTDRARAVDEAFNPIKTRVEKAANRLKPKLAAYAEKKEREAEAERQRLQAEADRAAKEAAMKAMEADRGDSIDAQVEAEQAAKQAEQAAKQAAKKIDTSIKSASGAGRTMATRSRKACTIENVRHLFMHYQHRPEVHDLLQRLANAEANAAGFPEDGKIPGVKIEIKKTIA
jgi:hypothetical protein